MANYLGKPETVLRRNELKALITEYKMARIESATNMVASAQETTDTRAILEEANTALEDIDGFNLIPRARVA